MNNLLIVASSLCIGGAERVIANLARYIDSNRFTVTICYLKRRGEIGDELVHEGHRVIGLPPAKNALGRYLSFLRLRRIVVANEIDLLHSHTTDTLADCAMVLLTLPRVKLIHTFHYGNYPHYVKRYMLLERLFSRAANRLVAVGREQCTTIRNTYHIQADRFETIPNGVELPLSAPHLEWQERLARTGLPVIGTICTFIEQKGLSYLLDTAQRMKLQGNDAVFVVVGDGPLRVEIEQQCKQMGLADRVYFTGWITSAASSMLPLFDVFFQPSLWEAMSMVVLEAMAAGRSVVVTNVGDNRHVVVEGETGMVVPPKDVVAMAQALSTLVHSKELRERYGKAGQRRFMKHYTAQAMALSYEDLYGELLWDEVRSR